MNDDLTTKPTLETLMEMMRVLRASLNRGFDDVNKRLDTVDARFDAVNGRLDTLNGRFSELDIRVDRMDSWVHKAYSEMVGLRADFTELKVQLKEHLPSPK